MRPFSAVWANKDGKLPFSLEGRWAAAASGAVGRPHSSVVFFFFLYPPRTLYCTLLFLLDAVLASIE